MNDTLLAMLFGLIAAIGWGISGFYDAKASRSVHPVVASLVVNGILTAVYTVAYFSFFNHHFVVNSAAILYAAIGGMIITIGAIAYFKALAIGPVTLVSPMSSAYPLVTTSLVIVLFGGTLQIGQGIAITLILAGILMATEFILSIAKRTVITKGPILGLLAALCWGIGYALVARAIRDLGWQLATLIELITMMIAFGIGISLLKDSKQVTRGSVIAAIRNRYIINASLIALIAALSFNIGFTYDTTGGAVVATFSAFYPILTVLLALRHFNEPIKRTRFVGASISITGVILLTIL